MKVKKCDTCAHKKMHLGAGPPDDYSCEYCAKGHWEGGPLFNEEIKTDPWKDCKDYQRVEKPEKTKP
jgi:hypothetical protein